MKQHLLTVGVALALACAAPILPARGQEKPAPASDGADLAAELKTLRADFDARMKEYWKPLFEAKDKSQGVVLDSTKHPARDFLPRFSSLADRAKGTKTGLAAESWIISNAGVSGASAKDAVAASFAAIGSTYLESPDLEPLLDRLGFARNAVGAQAIEDTLEKVAEKSPQESVRAAASFALADFFDKTCHDEKRARQAYERTVEKYGSTRYGASARVRLGVLGKLEVGKVAPDFEAVDQDGKKFKLSDYRGKVVMLDFWGFW